MPSSGQVHPERQLPVPDGEQGDGTPDSDAFLSYASLLMIKAAQALERDDIELHRELHQQLVQLRNAAAVHDTITEGASSRRKSFNDLEEDELLKAVPFEDGSADAEAVKEMRSDWVNEYASLGLIAAILMSAMAPCIYSTNIDEVVAADIRWFNQTLQHEGRFLRAPL